MARTPKGNNASAIANGARLAANSTHGVTCTFAGGCRVFDPNISKKHEMNWLCEHHGGANNHARANAKDNDCRDELPGTARRLRIARVRARQQQKTPKIFAHIPSFLDDVPKKPRPKAKFAAKAQSQLRREAALAELGLTEEDVLRFRK